ncbi:suppressor of cytokine signaling 2 isoform X2 [Malurus melanocephalus]|uniref:suppressor of cytokine signaling 2 isoform X2 n=1 Tax=Malurus melanocephalus TaxID=175006 RepID=UPI002548316B|nr:suppressor of cytokine signaling 2 isoform X2 [Malurus melanocephalus]
MMRFLESSWKAAFPLSASAQSRRFSPATGAVSPPGPRHRREPEQPDRPTSRRRQRRPPPRPAEPGLSPATSSLPKSPRAPGRVRLPQPRERGISGSAFATKRDHLLRRRFRRLRGGEEPRTDWATGWRIYPSPAPPGGDLSPRVPPLDAGKFRSGIARNTLCVGSASRGARR